VAVPAQKCQKWDVISKLGYLIGYDSYSTGYLIWFLGARKAEKAREVIFHEYAVVLAVLIPYGDIGTFRDNLVPTDYVMS
jgi:hypothetical protein